MFSVAYVFDFNILEITIDIDGAINFIGFLKYINNTDYYIPALITQKL